MKIKVFLISLIMGLVSGYAYAPEDKADYIWVKISHYSIYEKGEPDVSHLGIPIANNEGVACNVLPNGTVIYIEGIGYRKVDDRHPKKTLRKRGTNYVVDIRWTYGLEDKSQRDIKKYLNSRNPANPKRWVRVRIIKP